MSVFPLVRFVSAPEVDAEVRFDFNSAGTWSDTESWPDHEGFDLGAPSLEGEPDGIGTEYGFRQVSFNLLIKGHATALRAQGELARELARRTNWLMFQFSASSRPVWFKTYRSAPSAIDFEHVYHDTALWGVGVTVDAKSHSVGEEVTIGPTTITNDPFVDGNFHRLPPILGDAPAPLTMRVEPLVNDWADYEMLTSVAALPETLSYAGPIVWGVDGFTAGTDTGTVTADVFYPNDEYREIDFATDASLVTRLSGAAPAAPPVGRYLVLAYVERFSTDGEYTVRLGQKYNDGALTRWGKTVPLSRGASAYGYAAWMPLGDFTFPMSANTEAEGAAGTPSVPEIELQISRESGTSAARVSGFMLVPVSVANAGGARTLRSLFLGSGLGTTRSGLWNAEQEAFAAFDGATLSGELDPPRMNGQYPVAVPGYDNVVHFAQQIYTGEPVDSSVNNRDNTTSTFDVTFTYRPRYLYLAGD